MRGDGFVYQRHTRGCAGRTACDPGHKCSCVWWIGFYWRGKFVREHGGRTERDARRALRDRIKAVRGDRYVGPEEQRLTVSHLLEALARNLELRGKSLRSFTPHMKTMRRHFGTVRAVDMGGVAIERYQAEELRAEEPKSHATLNREIGCLRQAFRLAFKQGRISRVPYFPMLTEDNAREGFVEPESFEKLAAALPQDIADAARFAYLTGWRRGQLSQLRWEHVDRTNRLLAVPGTLTKNRRPHTIALEGALSSLIERRSERRQVARRDGTTFVSPFVFHRGDGKQLGDFRKSWAKACELAGTPGLLFHDLRRSAARNLVRAGVDRDVARKITGHKTESMFSRYNITDERDQRSALVALDRYVAERGKKP